MSHTTPPWSADRSNKTSVMSKDRLVASTDWQNIAQLNSPLNGEITKAENQANAAFIVKACNNYYEIRSALEHSQRVLIEAHRVLKASGTSEACDLSLEVRDRVKANEPTLMRNPGKVTS